MDQDHHALVVLREAAVVWARASREPATTPDDREFRRIDLALQKAAREFVAAEAKYDDQHA